MKRESLRPAITVKMAEGMYESSRKLNSSRRIPRCGLLLNKSITVTRAV